MALLDTLLKAGGPEIQRSVQSVSDVLSGINGNLVTINDNVLAAISRHDANTVRLDQLAARLDRMETTLAAISVAVNQLAYDPKPEQPDHEHDDLDRLDNLNRGNLPRAASVIG